MAAFLATFDKLVRHVRKKRTRYEWNRVTRQSTVYEEERLVLPRNVIVPPRYSENPRTKVRFLIAGQERVVESYRLFKYRTRRYLRRCAWRYFRKLAFHTPAEYVPAVAKALRRFTDDDLRQPENLLDSWGLMQACFGKHDALRFPASGCRLKDGRTMAELTAAPRWEHLWQTPAAFDELYSLFTTAPAKPVRTWARQVIERGHAARLASLSAEEVLKLLASDDAELQQFGATLLGRIEGVGRWTIDVWLKLLEVSDANACAAVCAQFEKHVSAGRLDLAGCLRLATSKAVPIARLGLKFLEAKKVTAPEERSSLRSLADARCEAVGAELLAWAWPIAVGADHYDRDVVTAWIDSLNESFRNAAWSHLTAARVTLDDPVLWSRLLETPFEDLRFHILRHLEARRFLPGASGDDVAPLWTSVLLGVHRGGRSKPVAVRQLCAAVERKPESVERLLPVLRAACRSIRGPERRAALAAVAGLVARVPELEPIVARDLPELVFSQPAAAVGGPA
ncbi:MAG: hypothetical protein QM775_11270 [Pirellulales bacterium]